MVLGKECLLHQEEKFCLIEDQKEEKKYQYRQNLIIRNK
jgi:hypothetical protein